MFAYVTRTSHEPSYGRGVLAILVLDAVYLALVWGAAGELVATVAASSGCGGALGAIVGTAVEVRTRLRPPPSPWTPRPSTPFGIYMGVGAAAGAAIGVALVILYLLGVVS